MTIAVTVFRMACVSALAAGLLIAAAGLLRPGGVPPGFAQADTAAPTILSLAITSDTGDEDSIWDDDGIYGIGDRIRVTVTFSEDITVTGAPQLELDIGGSAKSAEYESTNSEGVVFGYTVIEGDADDDGIAISENKLTLNGGSIKDAADNAADLSVKALAALSDHRVDGIRPTISQQVDLGAGNDGTDGVYLLGEVVRASARFSEEIIVEGAPQLALDLNGVTKAAPLEFIISKCEPSDGAFVLSLCVSEGGSSNRRGTFLHFAYTVTRGDEDSDGLGIGTNAIILNGGTIRDAAGNDADLTYEALADNARYIVDGVLPEITSVVITSDPGDDDTYGVGDVLEITVTFSETVWLAAGVTRNHVPRIKFDIGGEARMAGYSRLRSSMGGDSSDVVFAYTIQDGDNDDNGIAIGTNALQLVGATLYDKVVSLPGPGNNADIEHEGLADNAEHKVATTAVETDNDEQRPPKSGLLTIKGTVRVGETLTADTSGLTDEDGLDFAFATFAYLWVTEANGVPSVASLYSGSTYIIKASDEGKTISVRVLFYDDNGNAEVRISAATDPVKSASASNSPPTGLPTISGTAQVGETLTADTSSVADADGLTDVSYAYQWIRTDGGADADIAGATDSTYALTGDDQGKAIKVRVSFTDDSGNEETLTGGATGAVAATAPGVPQRLNVSPHDAGALNLYWEAPGSDGGSPITGYRVQWKQASGSWDTPGDVSEETVTGTSHTLTGLTGGVEYTVRVIAGNSAGDGPASFEVAAEAPEQESAIWSADLTVGVNDEETGYSYFTGFGSLSNTGFKVDDANYTVRLIVHSDDKLYFGLTKRMTAGFVLRVGAFEFSPGDASQLRGGTAYLLKWDQPGLSWSEGDKVRIGLTLSEDSPQTGPDENSPATGLPTISGTVLVGETLAADTSGIADGDGLSEAVFSYQWIRSDGNRDTDIAGATGSTYTLVSADVGKTIKVKVSFTDDAGNQESVTSAATAAVATVPGQPEHLNVSPHGAGALDLDWEAPGSDGGSPITGYKVQWKEAADSWDRPEDVSEETVTGATHTINGLTEGVEYAVRVMATNEVGEGPASAEKTGIPGETRAPEKVRSRVDGATLRVLYDEALDEGEGSAPPPDAFDVRVACKCDSTNWRDEEARREVDSVSVDGDTVVLTLAKAATAEDYVVVSYTPPSDAAAARTRDLAGNPAAGFGFSQVFNDTEEAAETEETSEADTPLTASLENRPEAHDGETPFTFELRFSEEFELSYKTLRDHAFTVSGGEVKKAQRMDKDSDTPNIRWLITVEPGGNGDVTITLPVTTDCTGDGAICTEDGRRLSNSLSFTVSGPGG